MSEPTERIYGLKCRVHAFTKKVIDNHGPKTIEYDTNITLLIPEYNDEWFRFAMAWLPETNEETAEAPAALHIPEAPFSRVYVRRGPCPKNSQDGHQGPCLHIANDALGKWLKTYKEGQTVQVRILSGDESGDAMMDQGMDSSQDGNFDLVSGQTNFPGQT